jgi:hypothetical protein
MADIRAAVVSYLSKHQWPCEARGEVLATPVAGKNGSWVAFFEIREEDEQLLVYSIIPFDIPTGRRSEAARYLTRANFGLAIGNFELDLDDGEVRYKTSIDIEGTQLVEPLIDHLFLANVVTVDHYLSGLRAVIEGDKADAVVAAVEGGDKGVGAGRRRRGRRT